MDILKIIKKKKLYRWAGKCVFQIISRGWILSAADEFRKSFFLVHIPQKLPGDLMKELKEAKHESSAQMRNEL
jgi:hypothetical protein